MLKRPVLNEYDAQAEQRFYDSLVRNLKRYAKSDDRIYEKEFCELMRTFDTEHSMEFSDEEQYDMFLERLFYRIKHSKSDAVKVEEFRDLIERSGF